MSLKNITLFAAAVAALAAGTASAQIVTATGTPNTTPALAEITFQGTLTSALQLTITSGSPETTLNATNTPSGPGVTATGTVDFGTFSTVNPTVSNGVAVRTTSGTPGAVVAARLLATLTYNGASNGSVQVTRTDAATTVPAGNVLYADTVSVDWTSGTAAGTALGATGVEICPSGNCASGTSIPHEIGIFLPDSQAAGAFSAVVTYTATAN